MKLKKKHRPMKMHDWMQTAGGQAVGVAIVDEFGQETIREISETTDPVAGEAFIRASEAYHAYLLAHIEFLLEKA